MPIVNWLVTLHRHRLKGYNFAALLGKGFLYTTALRHLCKCKIAQMNPKVKKVTSDTKVNIKQPMADISFMQQNVSFANHNSLQVTFGTRNDAHNYWKIKSKM